MAQVLIVNHNAGHDYSGAKRYGPLVRLTEGTVDVFRTDRVIARLRDALTSATPDDYVLLSGSPVLNALALAAWFRRFSRARLLIYDVLHKRYRLREVLREQFDPGAP